MRRGYWRKITKKINQFGGKKRTYFSLWGAREIKKLNNLGQDLVIMQMS